MEGLSWLDLTKVAITSSVVAAFITAGLGWLKDGRQRKQQRALNAKFDAIDLVSKLDALAAKCFFNYKNFHADWEKAQEERRDSSIDSCVMPPSLIEHSNLINIDSVIACRIAWLGNEIYLSFDEIHARWNEYLDSRDAYEQSANLVGYFGYEAMQLSQELRKKYQLTYQSPKWGMDGWVATLKQCSEDSKRFFKEGS